MRSLNGVYNNPKYFSMLKATLLRYTGYNLWANELLLSLIENKISNVKLDKEIISSFPSLRKTVYHLWDAEFIWIKRLKGESLNDWPSKSFNETFSEAKEKILARDKEFIHFIENSDDALLSMPFTYHNIEGKAFTNPVWESVLHCMNHSTYHRGQIVTMLRQLDVVDIPSTDYINYCRVKK
jgi:uncharacterized damage-inducible protein DinB